MWTHRSLWSAAGAILLAGCGGGGVTTPEVERAALERARQELGLAENVPLKATVWTGKERDGELTYCGTVSGEGDPGVPPQRFMAMGEPIDFQVWEGAHATSIPSQPGKFESWQATCGEGAQAA